MIIGYSYVLGLSAQQEIWLAFKEGVRGRLVTIDPDPADGPDLFVGHPD